MSSNYTVVYEPRQKDSQGRDLLCGPIESGPYGQQQAEFHASRYAHENGVPTYVIKTSTARKAKRTVVAEFAANHKMGAKARDN